LGSGAGSTMLSGIFYLNHQSIIIDNFWSAVLHCLL
jgi:hypothetical protein